MASGSGTDRRRAELDSGTAGSTGAVRSRVADQVFETLAQAILSGEFAHGQPLTAQRELAKRFQVSPVVVRQAVHRLEDLGLVRVRQGSPTIVLDPAHSGDINLVKLRLQLQGDPGTGMEVDARECQMLFIVQMLVLAERRVTPREVAILDYIVDRAEAQGADGEQLLAFRTEYWGQVAKATRNRLLEQQLVWWAHIIRELPSGPGHAPPVPIVALSFYRRLNRRLEAGDATAFFLEAVRPRLEGFDAMRASAARETARL